MTSQIGATVEKTGLFVNVGKGVEMETLRFEVTCVQEVTGDLWSWCRRFDSRRPLVMTFHHARLVVIK